MTTSNYRPPGGFPKWATDDLYTSGSVTVINTPTKIPPLSGEKAQGHSPSKRPAAQKMNWLQSQQSAFISYLADVGILNWGLYVLVDATATALDLSQTRADGTNKPFYNEVQQTWVLTGKNTNGGFYTGDDSGIFAPRSSASAFKLHFGCGTADGRNVLFNASATAGAGPHFTQSDNTGIGGLLGFTDRQLSYPGGTTLSAQDCTVFSNGDIVVVGGADSTFYAWTSTDNGTSFPTAHPVAVTGHSPNALSKVIIGAADRCFAWLYGTTANTGDRVFYSDDHGVTWTAGAGFGFDTIRDIHWMPDEGVYIVATDTDFYKTTDPGLGATAVSHIGSGAPYTYRCGAAGGSLLMIAVTAAAPLYARTLAYWDQVTEAREIHRDQFAVSTMAVNSLGQFCKTGTNYVRMSLAVSGVPRN